MNSDLNNKNERNSISSEEDTSNLSTPGDFSHEKDKKDRSITKLQLSNDRMNNSFKERLKSAKQHLQMIEHKKQSIDKRQVMLNGHQRLIVGNGWYFLTFMVKHYSNLNIFFYYSCLIFSGLNRCFGLYYFEQDVFSKHSN